MEGRPVPISIKCPSCDVKLKLKDSSVGRQFPCPKCGESFIATDPNAGEIETIPLRLPDTPGPEPRPRRRVKRPDSEGQPGATRPKSTSTKTKKRNAPTPATFKESPAFKVIVGVAILSVIVGGVALSGLLNSDSPEDSGADLVAENTTNETATTGQDDTARKDQQSSTDTNVEDPSNEGPQATSRQAEMVNREADNNDSPEPNPSKPVEVAANSGSQPSKPADQADKPTTTTPSKSPRVESSLPKSIASATSTNSKPAGESADKPSVKTTVAASESSTPPESRESVLKRIKAGTVYIEVTTTTGVQSGSGFRAIAPR